MPLEHKLIDVLSIVESLIAAHRTAKVDGDPEMIGLIEPALAHAGRRLALASDGNGESGSCLIEGSRSRGDRHH